MPKDFLPTIWDCRDIAGLPFQLTSLTFVSRGMPKFDYKPEFKGADGKVAVQLKLADPMMNAQKRGNVLIKQEGQWVPFEEYLEADPDTGHGTYQVPRKDFKTKEVERWPDTGNIKTEGKWEFVVIAQIAFSEETTITKKYGKRAGETVATGTEFEVFLKPSAYKSLYEQMQTTQKSNKDKSLLEAAWKLNHQAEGAPADHYKMEFVDWAAPVPSKASSPVAAKQAPINQDFDPSDIPF